MLIVWQQSSSVIAITNNILNIYSGMKKSFCVICSFFHSLEGRIFFYFINKQLNLILQCYSFIGIYGFLAFFEVKGTLKGSIWFEDINIAYIVFYFIFCFYEICIWKYFEHNMFIYCIFFSKYQHSMHFNNERLIMFKCNPPVYKTALKFKICARRGGHHCNLHV